MTRIPWDQYEAAYLLLACIDVLNNQISQSEAIERVSEALRKRAINKGKEIDSKYRNKNGISMQMKIMLSLYLQQNSGLHRASKLFIDIVELYRKDPKKVEKMIDNSIEGGTKLNINYREQFHRWLSSSVRPKNCFNIKKMCDIVDKYLKENKKYGFSIYEICELQDVQKIQTFIKKDIYFRARNSRQIDNIEKSMSFFYEYLKNNSKELFQKQDSNDDEKDRLANEEKTINTEKLAHIDKYRELLLEHYNKGFRLNDKLSIRRFRTQWKSIFNFDIQCSDNELCDTVMSICIRYGNMAYLPEVMLDKTRHARLFAYIRNMFLEGKKAIYYEAIFDEFSDEFSDSRINNVDMLKTYLSYYADGKMYISKYYIAENEEVEIDHREEVKRFLIEENTAVTTDKIVSNFSHLTREKIMVVLSGVNSEEFIRNQKGEYFHADIIEFSSDEMNKIVKWIKDAIDEKEYMGGKELTDLIKEELPSIHERYTFLTWLGLRDVIGYKLKNEFSFKGKIISDYGKELSMSNVFGNFAKSHDAFTLEQLNILKNDLDTPIYFDAVYDNSLRISKNEFVSKANAKFDIGATDEAIEMFCPNDYVSLKEVNLFGGFPNAYFNWNSFLLQHYVANYSEKFRLLHAGFTASSPVGAIVKRCSNIETFDDVLVRAVVENNVPLDSSQILEFLCSSGYLARRSYGKVDELISRAKIYLMNKGE